MRDRKKSHLKASARLPESNQQGLPEDSCRRAETPKAVSGGSYREQTAGAHPQTNTWRTLQGTHPSEEKQWRIVPHALYCSTCACGRHAHGHRRALVAPNCGRPLTGEGRYGITPVPATLQPASIQSSTNETKACHKALSIAFLAWSLLTRTQESCATDGREPYFQQ